MITIVITAYKEPRTIGKAITQILKNRIKEDYELIVMAPDKETLNEAKKYLKKSKKIKIVRDEGKGKPAALNLLFKKARGRIIVLTDGDVHIKENAIQYILKKFENPEIGAVTGRPISTNDKKTMLGFWSHLLTDAAHNTRMKRIKKGKMIVCSGYLYAIRSGIIENIPEDALSDDAVISHMIYEKGYITQYSPEAEVYIKYPDNFRDWIKQKKRSAGGYNQLARMVKNKERMRSFGKELTGILFVLGYPKNPSEMFHAIMLIFARIYLWILIFIDINLKKKDFKKIWVRVESTK